VTDDLECRRMRWVLTRGRHTSGDEPTDGPPGRPLPDDSGSQRGLDAPALPRCRGIVMRGLPEQLPPPVGLVHPWCARNEDLDASLRGRRSRWAPVPLHQRERPKVQSVSGGRPPRWLVSTSVSEVSALRETCNRALVPGRWGACPDPRDQDQAHRAGGSLARVDHRCERSAYPWGAAEHLRGCRTRRRPGL
jgi:hypothetical protein